MECATVQTSVGLSLIISRVQTRSGLFLLDQFREAGALVLARTKEAAANQALIVAKDFRCNSNIVVANRASICTRSRQGWALKTSSLSKNLELISCCSCDVKARQNRSKIELVIPV